MHPSYDWTLTFCGNLSHKLRQRVWAKKTWYGDPQSPLSPSRFNGDDCKVAEVIYDTSLASLNIYIIWSINFHMWVLENSARRKLGPVTPGTGLCELWPCVAVGQTSLACNSHKQDTTTNIYKLYNAHSFHVMASWSPCTSQFYDYRSKHQL